MNKAHDCGRGRSYERGRGLGDEDIMTGEKIIIVVFLIFNQTLILLYHVIELTRVFDTLDTLVEKDPSIKTLIASRYELYTEEMIDETVQFLKEERESL
jgi:hypothetical protein